MTTQPPANQPQPATQPQPGMHPLVKLGLGLLAAYAGIRVIGALAAPELPSPPRTRLPSAKRLAELQEMWRNLQLDDNRTNGARLENAGERMLREQYPDDEVHRQVTLTMPDGTEGRADFVVAHQDGTMTAFEAKNVDQSEDRHVAQLLRYSEGVERTFGVSTNTPGLIVPTRTVVPEEHAASVNVLRARTRRRRSI